MNPFEKLQIDSITLEHSKFLPSLTHSVQGIEVVI